MNVLILIAGLFGAALALAPKEAFFGAPAAAAALLAMVEGIEPKLAVQAVGLVP